MARDGARVVLLDGGLGQAQLLLGDVRLDLQVGQLVAQPLGLDAQGLALALANLHLLLEHDLALDGHIVLGLNVLERRRLVARLALEVVVLHLDVAQLQVQGALGVAQGGDLLLQDVLRAVGLGLALLVLGLRGWSAGGCCRGSACAIKRLLCVALHCIALGCAMKCCAGLRCRLSRTFHSSASKPTRSTFSCSLRSRFSLSSTSRSSSASSSLLDDWNSCSSASSVSYAVL